MIDGTRLPSFKDPEIHYSPEQRLLLKVMWENLEKAIAKAALKKGIIVVFGTGGDLTSHQGLEDIFYNPEKYKNENNNHNL